MVPAFAVLLAASAAGAALPCDLAAIAPNAVPAAIQSAPDAGAAPVTFKLREPILKLEDGATEGCATMVLVGEGRGDALPPTPGELKDLGVPTPPPVVVTMRAVPLDIDALSSTRAWLIIATVEGLSPNVKHSRQLAFASGGRLVVLSYTLTNKATDSFAWTVNAPPAEIHIAPGGEPIPIAVIVGPVRATGVKLLNAALLEKTSKTSFNAGGMLLCRERDAPCDGSELTLAANSPNQLWLRPSGPVAVAGKFSGQLTLTSAEKPDGNAFPLTLDVSGPGLQALGVLTILVGVVATWFISSYARNRLNRDQLLLPAAIIREQLASLQAKLRDGNHLPDVPRCRDKLHDLLGQLTPSALTAARLVPPRVPLPWDATPSQMDDYRQALQDFGDWAAILAAVVRDGLDEAWAMAPQVPAPPANEITATIRALDGLIAPTPANKPPILETVRQAITAELQRLHGTIPLPVGALAGIALFAARPPRPQTSAQISLEISRISKATWIFIMLATTALGYYVLILPNLGFGLPGDYWLCLLWGLGLPLGTQQLAQVSSGSVATSFGITVPR